MKSYLMIARSFPVFLLFLISSCATTKNTKDIWSKGLLQCANNDMLNSKKILFLGLSNSYVPGSVWRTPESDIFEPKWDLSEAITDSNKRSAYINYGVSLPCDTKFSSQSKSDFSLLLNTITKSIGGQANVDITRALSMNVSFSKWRLDNLKEIPYESWIKSKASGKYGKDLTNVPGINKEKRIVMKSAIWVEGLIVVLKFSSGYLDNIKGSVDLSKGLKIEGGAELSKSSSDEISIQSGKGFYMVGTFAAFNNGGFGVIANSNDETGLEKGEIDVPVNAAIKAKPGR
ncbi:MAG: hypothetical protein ABI707_13570 [Ferruginibacter sp.]